MTTVSPSTTGNPKTTVSPQEKQLAGLSQILQILREGTDKTLLLQTIVEYLQAEVDYSFIWLTLYDRLNHCLIGQGGCCPGTNKSVLNDRLPLDSGDLVEQAVIQQRPVIVPDLRSEPRSGKLGKIAQITGIQGSLLFPIRYRDICYGLAILGSERWGILARPGEKAQLSIVLGQLGASLQRLEFEAQNVNQKRVDEPLLKLLSQLHGLADLSQRLELIVADSHRFVEASRTSLYWFEPEKRYFWRRCSNRSGSNSSNSGGNSRSNPEENPDQGDLSVSDCLSFYQTLASDHLVSVGTAQSSLSPEATLQLLDKLRVRSILAAPILFQNRFLGFLAAEGTSARIWTEAEKQFLQGAAQLVGLVSPLDRVDQEIAQHRADHALLTQTSQAIRTEQDWNQILKTATAQIAQHFQVERVLLLAYEPEPGFFPIVFQHQEGRRKPLGDALAGLSEVDGRLLENREGVNIENLEVDLKFLAWRSPLLSAGIRSFLVARTTAQLPVEGVLILAHEAPRTWSPAQQTLLTALAQQLGLLLRQWHLQQQVEQQQHLYQTLQWGLTTIQQTDDLERLERVVTQSIAQVLKVPLVLLITWQPSRPKGKFAALAVSNPKFTLKAHTTVLVSDLLIQQTLGTDGLLQLSVDQLTADTRQWLNASGIGQVLTLALRTSPEDEPLGMMLVADQGDRFWPERILSLYGIFVSQLAWFRRFLLLIQTLQHSQSQLRQLNWYKHYRLLDLRRLLETSFNQLNNFTSSSPTGPGSNPIHYQQSLRQLSQVLTTLLQLLRQERWQLQVYQNTQSLASILKRSLERIDSLVKQNQLWVQVHAEDTSLELTSDIVKIEGILYQVLVFACTRATEQGRIDIWCRLLDAQTLDISITDHGPIEPRLLQELQQGRPSDALAPSALEQLPGLPLALAQTLLGDLGGSLEFYQLEDGRIMSRLVLPFITTRG